MNKKRGKFIVIEGGVGCGKSTQAKLLKERTGYTLLREPGGTEFGELIRDVLQENLAIKIDKMASMIGYMTCRANLIATEIRPRLMAGENIILDRYWTTTYSYQGAEGIKLNIILELAKIVCEELMFPDLFLFYDLDPKIGQLRKNVASQRQDRYDVKQLDFHNKARNLYHRFGRKYKKIWMSIDASKSIEEIHSKTMDILRKRKLVK